MRNMITVEEAEIIMGSNFIGPNELKGIKSIKLDIKDTIPNIEFSHEELSEKANDYILILGVSTMNDGTPVSIRTLCDHFGKNPIESEPCFYNQDWYNNEDFIDIPICDRWYLIRKHVYEDSRAVQPQELMERYIFPSAISCTYAFFISWLTIGEKLWYHDFVWCNDTDHNGDRIYVGKYNDIDGVNKNGFSIHRHLALRTCYACVDFE